MDMGVRGGGEKLKGVEQEEIMVRLYLYERINFKT